MPLNFVIADKRHAITEFQATLRFVGSLDPVDMTEVAVALEKVAADLNLPAKLVVPSFKLEVLGGPAIAPPTVSYGYQRFAPDGKIDARIAADANSITYVSRDYAGWASVRNSLADFVAAVGLPFFKRSQLVASCLLQYTNEFYSKAEGYHSVVEIFRDQSPWVSGIARSSSDLWHSHVGQFIPNGPSKDLVNVNVDVVLATNQDREGDFTQARLLILAARQFDVPGGKPQIFLPEEARESALSIFDEVHNLEKDVLRSTLSESYLTEVNA